MSREVAEESKGLNRLKTFYSFKERKNGSDEEMFRIRNSESFM